MIICGCGEGFKTQAGLNEHRRLKHDKMPMAAPPEPAKKIGQWTPEFRAFKSASSKAQWQGAHREQQLAAIREGQRKRRERERLEKAQAKIAPAPPPATLTCHPHHGPADTTCRLEEERNIAIFEAKVRGEHLRQRLAEAIAELVAFEVQRALESVRVPEPEPEPPEPAAPVVASVAVPVATKPARTIPLPRGDWAATRAMRTNRIEPVERPPLPAPLPTEVETVDQRDDPENAPFCEIIVQGAVPKGRPRFGKRGNVYTPKRTRDFEAAVAWMAKAEMRGRAPLTCRVRVDVQVGYKRDADLDNFIKAALDGINGVVFEDDRQVTAITAQKIKRTVFDAYMTIRVWPVGE